MNKRDFLKRTGLIGFNWMVFRHIASIASAQNAPQRPEEVFSLEVNVELVVLNVAVVDERGASVTALSREDFEVYEDDVLQEISDFWPVESPFSLVLLLDTSVSTRPSLVLIKKAASNFTDELRPNDQIAVGEVNLYVREVGGFTSDRKVLKRMIHSLSTYSYGGSRIYDGVAQAVRQLRKEKGGRKAIVLLTDGMENSSKTKFEDLRHLLASSDVVLYPVTVLNKDQQKDQLEDYIRNPSANDPPSYLKNARNSLSLLEEIYQIQTERLQALSEQTGGKMFLVSDLADLAGQYSKVAQELRNTFSLAYYSKIHQRANSIHRIRVVLRNPGYQIRTRTSYIVPETSHD
jgi:Ca-activated chloride channel family protein